MILSDLIEQNHCLPSNIPFKSVKKTSVIIPTNNVGKVDLYIDGNIAIALDFQDNV